MATKKSNPKLEPEPDCEDARKSDLKESLQFKIASKMYWESIIGYDSNTSECSGYCTDYCRCRTVNPIFNSINYKSIYNHICKGNQYASVQTISNIKEYCLDRGIRKLISKSDISIYGVKGYYGEEVAVASNGANEKLNTLVEYLNSHSETECIEYVLTLEYGYLLQDIKDKIWHLENVELNLVHAQNYKHISQEIVDKYKGEDNIVLCIKIQGGYRLIDGYHRYCAAVQDKNKTIRVIYCE